MDESALHFQYLIRKCRDDGINSIEPSKAAEDAWVDHIVDISRFNADFLAACTPGYYNNEGKPSRRSIQNGAYGKGPNPFFKITRAWRESGEMDGMMRG